MLLGFEYRILSLIALNYSRDIDGCFRFSEESYKRNILDDIGLRYLFKLENIGIISRAGGQIRVDSNKWIVLFINELEILLENLGSDYSCSYSNTTNELTFKNAKGINVNFILNFNTDEFDKVPNTINMCEVNSFKFHISWLELINDNNLLEMFYAYLKNEITRFSSNHRYRFNFFEGIGDDNLSEIFNFYIPKYFKDKKMDVEDVSQDIIDKVERLIRKDNYNAYEVVINEYKLVVIKHCNKIEFLSFLDEEVNYPDTIMREINILKQLLKNKVSEYRRLTMLEKHKIIDVSHKTISLISLILAPINALIFFGISVGISSMETIIKNAYFLGALGTMLIIVLLATIMWIIVPAVRLSIFKWEI